MAQKLTYDHCQNRVLNWHPARPGTMGSPWLAPAVASFPAIYSQRPKWCLPYDQGDLGSCTGNMWAGILAYFLLKTGKLTLAQANTPAGTPSRLMIYWLERFKEGTVNSDAGAAIPDGAWALNKYGACFENVIPYIVANFQVKPSATALRLALNDRIVKTNTISIGDMSTMKAAIMTANEPTGFGMTVYESFMSDQVAATGFVPVPNVNVEEVEGGHAIMFIGWDDTKVIPAVTYADGSTGGPWTGAFEGRNSWGTSWGDNGYFWMPYAMITPQLLSNMMVATQLQAALKGGKILLP